MTKAVFMLMVLLLGSALWALPQQQGPVTDNMVRINGGTFTMGSPANEPGRFGDEGPQHQVTVSSFDIGKNQVTVGEFRRFVEATGYRTDAEKGGGGWVWTGNDFEMILDANWKNPYFRQGDKHPVVLVSWNDAVQYCNWLSGQEGLMLAYMVSGTIVTLNPNADGYRLPTEAEWEYACRAGTTTPFSTGDNITTNQANYDGNNPYNNNAKGGYRRRTSPVESFAPNAWGLHDMHGNVNEWCWDLFGSYSSRAQTDPTGVSSGSLRVARGGSWLDYGEDLRSAFRCGIDPNSQGSYIGFRLVRAAQ
jgi:formylglycine-generating enzyme required for sulfatase activity